MGAWLRPSTATEDLGVLEEEVTEKVDNTTDGESTVGRTADDKFIIGVPRWWQVWDDQDNYQGSEFKEMMDFIDNWKERLPKPEPVDWDMPYDFGLPTREDAELHSVLTTSTPNSVASELMRPFDLPGQQVVSEHNWRLGSVFDPIRHALADWIEPKQDLFIGDLIRGIAQGTIECDVAKDVQPGSEGATHERVLGQLNTPHIEIRTKSRRRRKRKRGMAIPILAGEIARLARQDLGRLTKSDESTELVRVFCARAVNALRQDKDPRFVTLRSQELLNITEWASVMYWEDSLADEDIAEAMEHWKPGSGRPRSTISA
jgi:hypothetical protein